MGFSLGSAIKGALSGSAFGPAGIVAGAISGVADAQTAKSAYKWEQKQNIRLWNMQNEYNSPEAQMQRYIDAGLNPNLIYSQQNTATDIANASSLNQKQETLGGAINSMQARQQLQNMGLQNESQEIQNAYDKLYGGKQRAHQNYLLNQQGLMQHEAYERAKIENDFLKKLGASGKGIDTLFRALSLLRGM